MPNKQEQPDYSKFGEPVKDFSSFGEPVHPSETGAEGGFDKFGETVSDYVPQTGTLPDQGYANDKSGQYAFKPTLNVEIDNPEIGKQQEPYTFKGSHLYAGNIPILKDPILPTDNVIVQNYQLGKLNIADPLTVQKYGLWSKKPGSIEWKQALDQAYSERSQISETVKSLGPNLAPDLKWSDPKNWFMGLLGASAKTAPFMVEAGLEGVKQALPIATGLATGAAIAGQAGPQAAIPEELATVPGAFATGMTAGLTYGTIKYTMDVEGGRIYYQMLDRGVDPEKARMMALTGGLAIGVVETASQPVFAMVPGLKNVPGYMLFKNKYTAGIIANTLKKYATDYGIEITEEGIQQVIANVTNMAADSWDGKKRLDSKGFVEDMFEGSGTAMVDAAAGLALLSGPQLASAGLNTHKEFAHEKYREEIRTAVFEGKASEEHGMISIAINKQIENKSEKKAKPSTTFVTPPATTNELGEMVQGEPQKVKLFETAQEEVKFLKENVATPWKIEEKYGFRTSAEEHDVFSKKRIAIIASAITGEGQQPATIVGPIPRTSYVVNVNVGSGSQKAPSSKVGLTEVIRPEIQNSERTQALGIAQDWVANNELPVSSKGQSGKPIQSLLNFTQRNDDKPFLIEAVQESLIHKINDAIKKGTDQAALGDVISSYFKGIENLLVLVGGDPNKAGADTKVWFGGDKRIHTLGELPTLLPGYDLDFRSVNIAQVKLGDNSPEFTQSTRNLLKGLTVGKNLERDPNISIKDVVVGIVTEDNGELTVASNPELSPELVALQNHPARRKAVEVVRPSEWKSYLMRIKELGGLQLKSHKDRVVFDSRVEKVQALLDSESYHAFSVEADALVDYLHNHETDSTYHGPDPEFDEVKPSPGRQLRSLNPLTENNTKRRLASAAPAQPSNTKIEASQKPLPVGVVAKGASLKEEDMTSAKFNELRRKSDKAGNLENIEVRVLLGDKRVHSDGTKMSVVVRGQEHFHIAGINKSRTAIYVQQKETEKVWKKYLNRKPKKILNFLKATVHEDWIVDILPVGLTKKNFFQLVVEHERVHLATGIDGQKTDEIATTIIALERLGLLEHAEEMRSKTKLKEIKPRNTDAVISMASLQKQLQGKDVTTQRGIIQARLNEDPYADIPAMPSRPYEFTGVDWADQRVLERMTTHPELIDVKHQEDNALLMINNQIAKREDPSLSSVLDDVAFFAKDEEVLGVLEVVNEFIRKHNINVAVHTMEDVLSLDSVLDQDLKQQLAQELRPAYGGSLSLSEEVKSPLKTAWGLLRDVEKENSVFDAGMSMDEGGLTVEERQLLDIKKEAYRDQVSAQARIEAVAIERGILEARLNAQIKALEQVQSQDPKANTVGREMTIRRNQEKLAMLDQALMKMGTDQTKIDGYNQRKYKEVLATFPNGVEARVDESFSRWREQQTKEMREEIESSQETGEAGQGLFEDPIELANRVEQEDQDPDIVRDKEDDQLDEFFMGLPKGFKVAPEPTVNFTYPTEELGAHSKILAFARKVGLFGWARDFVGEGFMNDMESMARKRDSIRDSAYARSVLAQEAVSLERRVQEWNILNVITVSTIENEITKYLDAEGLKDTRLRNNELVSLNWKLVNAAEEITGGNKPGTYQIADIGLKHKHNSIEEGSAYVKAREQQMRFDGRWPVAIADQNLLKQRWASERDELAFFNELKPAMQKLVIHVANENAKLRDDQIRSGVFDAHNLFKMIQQGYFKRESNLSKAQTPEGYGGKSTYGTEKEPSRGLFRTYAEYFYDANRTGMFASVNYADLAGSYVHESFRRMDRHEAIKKFGRLIGPNGYPMLMFKHDVVAKGYEVRDRAQSWLLKHGYEQYKTGAGLAEHNNGGFSVPYVHSSGMSILNLLERDKKHITSGKGVLDTYNRINYLAKRTVLWAGTHVFTAQTTFNAAMVLSFKSGNPAAVWAEWLKDNASIYLRGPLKGLKILQGKEQPLALFKENQYEAEKLYYLTKNGFASLTFDWHMRALFDRIKDSAHPQRRAIMQNIMTWFDTKGGIDKYAFENVISKWVYKLASHVYDQEYAKHKSPNAAARVASAVSADICQIMNQWQYGQDASWLQLLLFARDNTVALVRTMTGAAYPAWAPLHKLRTNLVPSTFAGTAAGGLLGGGVGALIGGVAGASSNTIFHGKASKADMYAATPYYIKTLAGILFAEQITLNVMQYALMQSYGSDEDKKKPWAFQNDGGFLNKMRLALPWRQDITGRRMYADWMILREPRYIATLAMDPKRYFGSRMAFIPNIMARFWSGKDYRGRTIWNPNPIGPAENKANFDQTLDLFWNALGQSETADTGLPQEDLIKATGITTSIAPAEIPGSTFVQEQAKTEAERRYNWFQDQIRSEVDTHPHLALKAVKEGIPVAGHIVKWSLENYMNWLHKPVADNANWIVNQTVKERTMGIGGPDYKAKLYPEPKVAEAFSGDQNS